MHWRTTLLLVSLCRVSSSIGQDRQKSATADTILNLNLNSTGGRRDPDAQLERTVGEALKQASAAASGAGGLIWDLYADYYTATGFPASAREAALKQVRSCCGCFISNSCARKRKRYCCIYWTSVPGVFVPLGRRAPSVGNMTFGWHYSVFHPCICSW